MSFFLGTICRSHIQSCSGGGQTARRHAYARSLPAACLTKIGAYSYVPGVKCLSSKSSRTGLPYVTAVVTATRSTVLHSDTTPRTPHAHFVPSGTGLACIC